MKYYGIVGPGISGVYEDWKQVEALIQIFPYCKYRKFFDEQECWNFVYQYRYTKSDLSMSKYGDTFDNLYLQLSYIVTPNRWYFTFNTEHFGNILIDEVDGVRIRYTATCVMLEEATPYELNPEMIVPHLQAIERAISFVGSFADVDIIVPDHSIYYALTTYSGDQEDIKNIKEYLADRIGKVSFSIKVR